MNQSEMTGAVTAFYAHQQPPARGGRFAQPLELAFLTSFGARCLRFARAACVAVAALAITAPVALASVQEAQGVVASLAVATLAALAFSARLLAWLERVQRRRYLERCRNWPER